MEEVVGRRVLVVFFREGYLGFLFLDEYGGYEVIAVGEGGCV